jgi:hypothetical protein
MMELCVLLTLSEIRRKTEFQQISWRFYGISLRRYLFALYLAYCEHGIYKIDIEGVRKCGCKCHTSYLSSKVESR